METAAVSCETATTLEQWGKMNRIASILAITTFAFFSYACSGPSDPDCGGDGVITSESHWANCANGAPNASTNNISDAGSGNNATTANNGSNSGANNTEADAGHVADAGTETDAGADAGTDAGIPETCSAFRWDDTELTFQEAHCAESGSTFECSCFDLGDTMSLALTCEEALTECGASPDEISGCEVSAEAGCDRTADGWECTCPGIDGVFQSDALTCDVAFWSSCYTDDFCESSITDGTARCEPILDQDLVSSGRSCSCVVDGVVVKGPETLSGASCVDDVSAYCANL